MPEPTPFHERTSRLCSSLAWKEWSGYHAVCRYGSSLEPEYLAIRHALALIDVSPLFKYEVRGKGAGELLSRMLARRVARLRPGRVRYVCWCDDDGMVLDDGTVARLQDERFRLTSNLPAGVWLRRHLRGTDAQIEDVSDRLGALALQGPYSREVLADVCGPELERLRFFRVTRARLAGVDVEVSRTGYTGDLGYEIWVAREHALKVWDALMGAGHTRRIQAAGLDAMDLARVEAGFVLNGVDYHSAHRCPIDSRKSTPFEIGLGRAVELEREPFTGQTALVRHARRGPRRLLTGLEYDWDAFENLFARHGLPPEVAPGAWRSSVPVYDADGQQVGRASSGAWSPVLKRKIALATLDTAFGVVGRRLEVEVTVEYERRKGVATVVETPFFDPKRKRA